LHLEAKVQTPNNQIREGEPRGKEVQAYKFGGHVGEKQMLTLGLVKDAYE
jgi:hypothetical protein